MYNRAACQTRSSELQFDRAETQKTWRDRIKAQAKNIEAMKAKVSPELKNTIDVLMNKFPFSSTDECLPDSRSLDRVTPSITMSNSPSPRRSPSQAEFTDNLMKWVQPIAQSRGLSVRNFQSDWQNGYVFCSPHHCYKTLRFLYRRLITH